MAIIQLEWGHIWGLSGTVRTSNECQRQEWPGRLQWADPCRTTCDSPRVFAHSRGHLRHRLRFLRGAGFRTGRVAGNSARSRMLRAAARAAGPASFWQFPTLLWLNASDAAIRALWIAGTLLGLVAAAGMVAASGAGGVPGAVAVGLRRRTGLLRLPVGLSAGRNRVPGDFCRPVAGARLALPLAAVPSDLLQRRSQTGQRRPHLAQPHRPPIPLRDPAPAHTAGVVHAPVARGFSKGLDRRWCFSPNWRCRSSSSARALRCIGAAITVTLQLLILLTGNYTFFNWLTIALCLWLVIEPDRALPAPCPTAR